MSTHTINSGEAQILTPLQARNNFEQLDALDELCHWIAAKEQDSIKRAQLVHFLFLYHFSII